MSANHEPESELLELHIEALKAERIPNGPSQRAATATLAMLREGGSSADTGINTSATGRRFLERLVAMIVQYRVAAAVLIGLGLMALYLMSPIFSTLGTSVAFADVANKLKSVRTLVYNSTVTLPGKPPQTTRNFLADQGRLRMEHPGDIVTIWSGKTALTLNRPLKIAMRLDFDSAVHQAQPNLMESLRSLGQSQGEPIGEKTIDGIETHGFRIENIAGNRTALGGQTMTIWADNKTALPVRVEAVYSTPEGDVSVVMDDFEIDPPLDESLFSMEVPQGYTLSTQSVELPKSFKPEDVVADFLRLYTDASGGSFPASLTDSTAPTKTIIGNGGDSQAQMMKFSTRSGAMYGALVAIKSGYGYAGQDVKLGDADKVVFWYKPSGSNNYRALFGDLHVGDVSSAQLPSTQPAKP